MILPRYRKPVPSEEGLSPGLYPSGVSTWNFSEAHFSADGLHVNARLDEERSRIPVIMAADEHGKQGTGGGQRRLVSRQRSQTALRAGARTNADFGLRFRTEDGSCSCATVGPDEVQVRWKRTERRIF